MAPRGTLFSGALAALALASCGGEAEEDSSVRYVHHEIAFVGAPYEISLEAVNDPELVAYDGLHPPESSIAVGPMRSCRSSRICCEIEPRC